MQEEDFFCVDLIGFFTILDVFREAIAERWHHPTSIEIATRDISVMIDTDK
jgi:hypothetical protein